MRLSCYWSWISSSHCQNCCGSADYFDNAMTKFIVNNRTEALKTDVNLFFTTTDCRISRSCSLTRRKNFKFMCPSAYWPWNLASERAWISAVIVTKIFFHLCVKRWESQLFLFQLKQHFKIHLLLKLATTNQPFHFAYCIKISRQNYTTLTIYQVRLYHFSAQDQEDYLAVLRRCQGGEETSSRTPGEGNPAEEILKTEGP